ncbi:MAG: MFS transporter [Rubrivivax sp.]|nr:MFS transporter [Rubrivivax sp.]
MNRWEALSILMLLAFLNYLDRNLLPPLLDPIGRELGLSNAELGALSTVFHIIYALSAPLVGYLSDRITRKKILLLALVVWSLVTAASGLATGFLSLLILRSLTGLGEGGYFPTAVSLIGDLFEPRQRGLAIALHGVCTTLGGGAGLAVGGKLGERLSWRMPFFLAIIPGLVLAAVIAARFREPPRGRMRELRAPPAAGPAGDRLVRRSYTRIVLSPAVLLIALSASTAAFMTAALTNFLPRFLTVERGLTVGSAGTATGLFFLITIPGQLAGGVLSDRLAARGPAVRPFFAGFPYLLAAPAVLAVTQLSSVPAVLLCYGFAQLARGFAEPNIYGTVIDAVPALERGTAQGFMLAATFGGASLGSWVTGLVIDASGYSAAFAVLAGFSAVAGLLALVLSRYLRTRR